MVTKVKNIIGGIVASISSQLFMEHVSFHDSETGLRTNLSDSDERFAGWMGLLAILMVLLIVGCVLGVILDEVT